jgi:hypothetical protein
MAPALHELLSAVSTLRDDVLAESEELYNSWQSRIERHAFVPSAQNLAAYLALEKVGDDWLLEVMQAPPDGKKIRADKGLNFPDTALNIRALTETDRDDLGFIVMC